MIRKTQAKILTMIGIIVINPAWGGNVYIAADSYEYFTGLGDYNLDYRPQGWVLGGAFDLNEKFELQYEFGNWEDEIQFSEPGEGQSDFESTLKNIGIGYSIDNWRVNFSYSELSDEKQVLLGATTPDLVDLRNDTDSLRLNLRYLQLVGSWVYSYEGGLLWNRSNAQTQINSENLMVLQELESAYAMGKIGLDYFIGRSAESGWYLGSSISWFQEISSDVQTEEFDLSTIEDRPGPVMMGGRRDNRRNGRVNTLGGNVGSGIDGASVNRTFGDSFGLVNLYTTYLFNQDWSVDWTTSIGFAGDVNATTHTLLLNYQF